MNELQKLYDDLYKMMVMQKALKDNEEAMGNQPMAKWHEGQAFAYKTVLDKLAIYHGCISAIKE